MRVSQFSISGRRNEALGLSAGGRVVSLVDHSIVAGITSCGRLFS